MPYPEKVEIIEVGPRDGFQNIPEWIPTELKLEVIDGLVKSNLKKIQVTSFVHPKAVPQMSDARLVAATALEKYPDVNFSALVPNLYGARTAYECGIRMISFVISASEEHNMSNVNRTIGQSFSELEKLRDELPDIDIQLDMAVAFGCPFRGYIPLASVLKMIEKACELNINRVCLCDTSGMADQLQIEKVTTAAMSEYPGMPFSIHLHDVGGKGLQNTLAGIQNGIGTVETSIGGMGGCPFLPDASGNTATEGLVHVLDEMGIATGVNQVNLAIVAGLIKSRITGKTKMG